MVNEAEANKDADKKRREAVEAHNQLDSSNLYCREITKRWW